MPYNPDLRVGYKELGPGEYYVSIEERLRQTPKEKGEWGGERGESLFRPFDAEAITCLRDWGTDGIVYKDCFPDFRPVSVEVVRIENMTELRASNFSKADYNCAQKWNSELKDGRGDWSRGDVKRFRQEHKCTWHECEDRTTMCLVKSGVHNECTHSGGVAECKARNEMKTGGGFDA